MTKDERPTSVTVIGWFWVILGGIMCLSVFLGIAAFLMIKETANNTLNVNAGSPYLMPMFPLILILQISVAMASIVGGVYFHRMKKWSRSLLEILTWLFIMLIIAFGILGISKIASGLPNSIQVVDIVGITMMAAMFMLYATPFVIVLIYLRGKRIRNLMKT